MHVRILVALQLCISLSLQAFTTLKNIEDYGKKHLEPFLFQENMGLIPYSHGYSRKKPSLIAHFLEVASLYKPLWSPLLLKQRLTLVTQERERKGYRGDYIFITTAQPGTEVIIIGPVVGAFHSLYRNLTELKKKGFINENLEIIKPHCFLVFLGNVINSSPYGLETLDIVLSLMEKNPTTVFYIRGLYENNVYWKNTHLKQQLRTQASYISAEPTPLTHLLTRFFNTLPLGIYFNGKSVKEGIIRLSYFAIDDHTFDEASCEKDFTSYHTTVDVCKLKPVREEEKKEIPFTALIKGENRLISYERYPGLSLLEPESGTTVWSVFSGPSTTYQKDFSFFHDTFTLLKLQIPLTQSTITLYYQDIRDLTGYKKGKTFNILTGYAMPSGILTYTPFAHLFCKDSTILSPESSTPSLPLVHLGSCLDLSDGNQVNGKGFKAGIAAAINRANQNATSKLYKVTILDDAYNAGLTRQRVEHLMKKNTNLILMPVGTAPLMGLLDLIKEKKIFVFFPASGSTIFRQPSLTHIVHFRVSYTQEAQALMYHMIHTMRSSRFAFFYQDDNYGKSALEAAKKVLAVEGIKEWTEASYPPNTLHIEKAVESIRNSAADTIVLFSIASVTLEFLRKLGTEFLSGKKLVAFSPLSEKTFRQFVTSTGLSVTFGHFVPNPETSTLEIVKEYREEIVKQGLPISSYSLMGYIGASLAIDLLNNIKGPITFKAILELLHQIKDYSFKGLTLHYNPGNHELAHYLWIETPQGEWIEQDVHALEKILQTKKRI